MQHRATDWNPGLETAALSDIGLRRTNNQDSYAVVAASSHDAWLQRGHLFMVADGMGAHAAGELASKLAVDTVPLTYHKLVEREAPEALRLAVEDANAKIHGRGQANADFHGMGTTSSVLLLLPEGAVVAHVGDSRVYRLRGHQLEQLSFDHSLVWEMAAGGKSNDQDVPSYIPKNIITRSLGPSSEVKVDLEGPFPLNVGDTFLVCSDGLTGQVGDEEIGIILGSLKPQEAVRALVDLANLRGGPDNITVIVVRVVGSSAVNGAPRGNKRSGRGEKPKTPLAMSILGWLAVVALLGGAALSVVAAQQTLAIGGVVLAGLLAVALLAAPAVRGATSVAAPTDALGRGPHTSQQSEPNPAFVEKLDKLVKQLVAAATEEQWNIRWADFEKLRDEAQRLAERQDYAGAVRNYCLAVSFMMEEIREQRRKGAAPERGGD